MDFSTQACRMIKRAAFAALVLSHVLLNHSSAAAAGTSVGDFPVMIHCEGKGLHRFYYLSKIGSDGVAVYLSLDGQGGKFSLDGTAKRVLPGASGTCVDKTLEQLRSAGQTYDMQPSAH